MIRKLAFIAAAALLSGAAPGTWRHPAEQDRPGTAEDVSLTAAGEILLAPGGTELAPGDTDEPTPTLLWAAAMDGRRNIFVGGGIGARVIRINSDGVPAPFFDVDDFGVRAMAGSLGGQLYVATLPTGRIYKLDDEGGAEVYFEPEERYMWSLATDPFDRLYVGTGERGVIYVVTGPGEAEVFLDTDEPHITALATDPTGRIIAGSAGRGLLYRLSNEGRPDLLLDSTLEEISSIAVASDGTVYAAAIDGPRYRTRDRRRGDDLTIEVTTSSEGDPLEEAADAADKIVVDLGEILPGDGDRAARPLSIVYRVRPGSTPVEIYRSSTERIYSLVLDSRGHLLMGSGPRGRLYRAEPDGSVTLVRTYEAAAITGLIASDNEETIVLTSNPGRVFTLEAAPATSGYYLSPVHDAGSIAGWGAARWDADQPKGTRVDLDARSGNSPLPDSTWSSWFKIDDDSRGSSLSVPPGRYLQWRAKLSRLRTKATPLLRSVTITYLPENLPPVVRQVHVGEPGEVPAAQARKDRGESEGGPAGKKPTGTRWVTWSSADPSGDELTHAVAVRKDGDPDWTLLAESVKEPPYALDPARLDEGTYVLRVTASDSRDRDEARARSGEARSAPFFVDKTPPVIDPGAPKVENDELQLQLTVKDQPGPVKECLWSADGSGGWRRLLPEDGIADTPSESFMLRTARGGLGGSLHLKAADAAGNEVTLEVVLPPGR